MPRLHLEELLQAAEFWEWVWFRPSSLGLDARFRAARHRVALSRETHA